MGFGKDGQGQILYDSVHVTLGAVTTKDVVTMTSPYATNTIEDFRMLRMDYWMGILPHPDILVLTGPVVIGVAAGNLTAAEIEEALEAVPLDQSSTLLEHSNRAVWPLEVFMLADTDAPANTQMTVAKGTFNPRWTFANPHAWKWWIYNSGIVTLVAGINVDIVAKCFGMWVQ